MRALRMLRIAGWLEGTSFLVLVFVAMPLKHLYGQPLAVRVVGLAHGLLFVAYLFALAITAGERGWPVRRSALGVLAGLLPFGVFVFDAQLRRELHE